MKKESFMEDLLSKRLSEAPVPPEVSDNLEPVWHEAGSGMNVEQLRIGKKPLQYLFKYLCGDVRALPYVIIVMYSVMKYEKDWEELAMVKSLSSFFLYSLTVMY